MRVAVYMLMVAAVGAGIASVAADRADLALSCWVSAAVLLASDVYVRWIRPRSSLEQQMVVWGLGGGVLFVIALLGAVDLIKMQADGTVLLFVASFGAILCADGIRRGIRKMRGD